MSNPEISVIVTNFNHSKYIEQAIESIQDQTFGDTEIIVVDDCSTDGSKEIIVAMAGEDDRIRPVFLPENRGKWNALNTGIRGAKSPIITLQDADDASVKDRLTRQWQVLKDEKSYHNLCGFAHCYNDTDMADALQLDAAKCFVGYDIMDHAAVTKAVHLGHKTEGINHYFVGQDYEVHGASTMFYKQLWDHGMKFLPGNMGLRCQKAEDSDHNTKLTLLLQKTSVLKEPLYAYRRGTSTNSAYREGL